MREKQTIHACLPLTDFLPSCSRNRVAAGNHVTPQVCRTFFRHCECPPVRNYGEAPSCLPVNFPLPFRPFRGAPMKTSIRDVLRFSNDEASLCTFYFRLEWIINKELRQLSKRAIEFSRWRIGMVVIEETEREREKERERNADSLFLSLRSFLRHACLLLSYHLLLSSVIILILSVIDLVKTRCNYYIIIFRCAISSWFNLQNPESGISFLYIALLNWRYWRSSLDSMFLLHRFYSSLRRKQRIFAG